MHKKVIYHLQKIKQQFTETCEICKGKQCNVCCAKFDLYERYAKAGIPIKYWNLELEQNSGSAEGIFKYVDQLQLAYEEGQGVFAYGKNGNGKTLSACTIGKEAIKKGFSVRYIFLGEVINAFINTMYNTFERDKLKSDILEVDFLILDDIDKAYISEESKYVNSILDTLFRTRVQNCLPVIMTANKPIGDILSSNTEEVFTKSLLSLFNESLLSILFMGSDKRVELKKEARKKFLGE